MFNINLIIIDFILVFQIVFIISKLNSVSLDALKNLVQICL